MTDLVDCLRPAVLAISNIHFLRGLVRLEINSISYARAPFSLCARFTFHVEATDKVSELIRQVKAKGMGVGVALKPATPVEVRSLS